MLRLSALALFSSIAFASVGIATVDLPSSSSDCGAFKWPVLCLMMATFAHCGHTVQMKCAIFFEIRPLIGHQCPIMSTSRTHITISERLYQKGLKRAEAGDYTSFSEYVAALIRADYEANRKPANSGASSTVAEPDVPYGNAQELTDAMQEQTTKIKDLLAKNSEPAALKLVDQDESAADAGSSHTSSAKQKKAR
jgi:hypothetical protein